MEPRILYLFTGVRGGLLESVRRGEDPGDGTWGMVRLARYGIVAEHRELEQLLPGAWARWVRSRVLGSYGAHLPFFFSFFRYDIIFTAGAFVSQLLFVLSWLVFRFRRPLWVMHDFSIMGFLGGERTVRQRVFRFMVEHADGIVTVGREEAERLKTRFPHLSGRIVYIPFGVDVGFFQPRAVPEARSILAVGVDPDRDWETLFAACEGLDVPVVAASRPRGSKDVKLPPFVRRQLFPIKELVNEYARAAMVVIPLDTRAGINDAMGCTALFEAMAMGKAVVATSTHTMRSYITDGENGILVPEGDAIAMRVAIETLLDDPEKRRRLGEKARIFAVEHLAAEKMAERLARYFKDLLAKV